MKKRLHDIDIWNKLWFRRLSHAEKLAWLYIKDRCDNVGVWEPDKEMLNFFIGDDIDLKEMAIKLNGNVEVLKNGKWWLIDFCDFQYGILDEESKSKPIMSYIKLLKHHGLWTQYKGYAKGMQRVSVTLKDKDKDKDKDKEKEKEKEYAPTVSMLPNTYTDLCKRFGKGVIDEYIEKISDWQLSNGKRKKDMAATIKNWMRRDKGVGSISELEIKAPAVCPDCGKSVSVEIKHGADYCYSCKAKIGGSDD